MATGFVVLLLLISALLWTYARASANRPHDLLLAGTALSILERVSVGPEGATVDLPIILVTFGLSIIVQNGLQGVYGADTRKVFAGAIETATIHVGGDVNVGVLPLIIFVSAVVMVWGLDRILYLLGLHERDVDEILG